VKFEGRILFRQFIAGAKAFTGAHVVPVGRAEMRMKSADETQSLQRLYHQAKLAIAVRFYSTQ
jgi:hypothetical protein